jgi:hypothetical protein
LTFSLLSLLITTMANKRYISFLDGLHGKILCMWEQSFDHACWSLLVILLDTNLHESHVGLSFYKSLVVTNNRLCLSHMRDFVRAFFFDKSCSNSRVSGWRAFSFLWYMQLSIQN